LFFSSSKPFNIGSLCAAASSISAILLFISSTEVETVEATTRLSAISSVSCEIFSESSMLSVAFSVFFVEISSISS
jgi:hypothetical protein